MPWWPACHPWPAPAASFVRPVPHAAVSAMLANSRNFQLVSVDGGWQHSCYATKPSLRPLYCRSKPSCFPQPNNLIAMVTVCWKLLRSHHNGEKNKNNFSPCIDASKKKLYDKLCPKLDCGQLAFNPAQDPHVALAALAATRLLLLSKSLPPKHHKLKHFDFPPRAFPACISMHHTRHSSRHFCNSEPSLTNFLWLS